MFLDESGANTDMVRRYGRSRDKARVVDHAPLNTPKSTKALSHGFAVAAVEYRLSGEATFPAAVVDCRQAIRWLREHGAGYKVNPDKICVIGGSAGGNLTAMMGMNIEVFPDEEGKAFASEPKVVAAVDQFGPMSFKTMDKHARDNGVSFVDHDSASSPESKYIGIPIEKATQEQCAPANPLTYAGERMCPLLVQHGTMDKLVPYGQSVEFVEGLMAKGLGTKVTFSSLEGADHDDKMFYTEENLDFIFAFLKAQL